MNKKTTEMIDELVKVYHQHDERSEMIMKDIISFLPKDSLAIDYIYKNYLNDYAVKSEFECGKRLIDEIANIVQLPIEPLLNLIKNDKISWTHRKSLCRTVCKQFCWLKTETLLIAIDSMCSVTDLHAICTIMANFDQYVTEDNALVVLQRCLRYTNTKSTREQYYIIETFVERADVNEKFYRLALVHTKIAHEIVLLSVSLLDKTYDSNNQLVKMAENSSRDSQLANDYLDLYVGMYIAKE